MTRYGVLAVTIFTLLALGTLWVAAQDATEVSNAACAPAVEAIWTAASNACISGPIGYACNGGAAPQVEPAGPVSNALNPVGSLVDVGVIDIIHSLGVSDTGGGLVWLRSPQPLQFTGLLVGDTLVQDTTPPDFPAWQSMVVQTGVNAASCGAVPDNAFVVQTPLNQPVNIAINGVSLGLNGTVMVQTMGDATMFLGLSGETLLFSVGQSQTLRPGEQIAVSYSGGNFATPLTSPSLPLPLDENLVQNFPVALLDRPIILPQPGYVTTDGAVNLRISPSTDAGVIIQVPGGQVLSVLGRDPSGQWYHVRLDSGETGWMFAQLLLQNIGNIQAVYDATPLPPQRYGEIGRTATVLAPIGANMRQAPDVTFPMVMTIPDRAIVNLLARSPYSPWVKVEFNGVVGWLALITLQTQAVIEALPVDNDVPPPPQPTLVPGSFGNAFPDPNKDG